MNGSSGLRDLTKCLGKGGYLQWIRIPSRGGEKQTSLSLIATCTDAETEVKGDSHAEVELFRLSFDYSEVLIHIFFSFR